jgi:hypothetical protein
MWLSALEEDLIHVLSILLCFGLQACVVLSAKLFGNGALPTILRHIRFAYSVVCKRLHHQHRLERPTTTICCKHGLCLQRHCLVAASGLVFLPFSLITTTLNRDGKQKMMSVDSSCFDPQFYCASQLKLNLNLPGKLVNKGSVDVCA